MSAKIDIVSRCCFCSFRCNGHDMPFFTSLRAWPLVRFRSRFNFVFLFPTRYNTNKFVFYSCFERRFCCAWHNSSKLELTLLKLLSFRSWSKLHFRHLNAIFCSRLLQKVPTLGLAWLVRPNEPCVSTLGVFFVFEGCVFRLFFVILWLLNKDGLLCLNICI